LHQTDDFCTIKIDDNGKKLFICFIYLSPNSTCSLDSAFSNLNPYNEHCIIIGDLNARIGKYQHPYFNSSYQFVDATRKTKDLFVNPRGRQLIKILEKSYYQVINGNSPSDKEGELTFCNLNGSSLIDLCLASQNLSDYTDLRVLESEESCHFPILITVQEQADTTIKTIIPRIIWNHAQSENFQFNLDNILTNHNKPKIDINSFNQALIQAADSCKMVVNKTLSGKPQCYGPAWFDKKCAQAKIKTRKSLRELRKDKETKTACETTNKYLEARKIYKSLIKAKRVRFTCKLDNALTNVKNSSEFYRAISYFKPKRANAATSEYVKPDEFKDYFSRIFRNDNKNIEFDKVSFKEDITLDKDFDFAELNQTIKQLSNKKAPGPDTIPNELFKNLNTEHRLILLDSINELWREQRTPASWSEIMISPIFKKGQKDDPKNYRPISLVNTSLKLLTLLMTNRLNTWCSNNKTISDYQAAYKKGTGCQDHVFVLNSVIQYHLQSKNNRLFALFIDLSAAFDSIDHQKLWHKLVKIGLSSKFISVIQNI